MASQPQEIAEGVYRLSIRGSNVYFVRSGESWVLIDTAWANSERLIQQAAEVLFGANTRPAAILLTHVHPDHDGAAPELARMWGVPVYMHPDELPLAAGEKTAIEACPAGPLDRWLILPLMRVMPPRVYEAIRARGAAFMEVARALDAGVGIPDLPGWECVATPGHSPGHIAFFRTSDRVLIAGDAVLTVNLNSVWDLLRNKQRVSGPPYISTWNWQAAKASVTALARLEPRVLACGHGIPMTGIGTARELRALADSFSSSGAEKGASDASEEMPVGASRAERALFTLSAAGVPIGLFALRRLGRLGGLLLEVAIGALGVRAGVMLAMGTARRLQVVPRLLLFAETALDGLATVAGFWVWVWRPFIRPALVARQRWRRIRLPAKRANTSWGTPVAAVAWVSALVVHTARMAIYISPGRGLRNNAADITQPPRKVEANERSELTDVMPV